MATIDDVARDAGVSRSTVSYVLSGKRSISAGTRRRVEASISVLAYRPHAGARALASSRTGVLALVIPLRTDVNVPVVMEFVASIARQARVHDHDVLLLTEDEGAEGLRRVAGSSMCDAIIVMEVEAADPRVPVLRGLALPSVLVGVPADPEGLPCVDLDFVASGRACVDHLADLGHTEVALVAPSPAVYARGTGFAGRFLQGFTGAARDRRVRVSTHPCAPSAGEATRCVEAILTERPAVTALVVHNEAALGPLLSVVRERGLAVPGDLSVLALCPDDVAAAHAVRLTSVAIPVDQVSRVAVQVAVDQLDGARRSGVTLIPPRLTVRDSTAAPRPSAV